MTNLIDDPASAEPEAALRAMLADYVNCAGASCQ